MLKLFSEKHNNLIRLSLSLFCRVPFGQTYRTVEADYMHSKTVLELNSVSITLTHLIFWN